MPWQTPRLTNLWRCWLSKPLDEGARMIRGLVAAACLCCLVSPSLAVDYIQRTANDGALVMENIPPIPAEVVDGLLRFHNMRAARMF